MRVCTYSVWVRTSRLSSIAHATPHQIIGVDLSMAMKNCINKRIEISLELNLPNNNKQNLFEF